MGIPNDRKTAGNFGFQVLAFLCFLACAIAFSAVDLDKMQSLALSRYGPNTEKTVVEWRTMIENIKPLPDIEKLAVWPRPRKIREPNYRFGATCCSGCLRMVWVSTTMMMESDYVPV